jgi:beta-lactamase regulating signal transducer with metallopeptidase domain
MNLSQTLGWTLVHSVWEIAVIAVAFLLVNLGLRRANPNVRYLAALTALAACLIAPTITGINLAQDVFSPKPTDFSLPLKSTSAKVEPLLLTIWLPTEANHSPKVNVLGERLTPILPSVVVFWLLGLAVMCVRLAGGLLVLERIKYRAMFSGDDHWQAITASLAGKLGVRRSVLLKISHQINSPAVIGMFKVVILLPASVVTKLSPEDVEALLTHELAHVRRFDYAVNLVQSMVEALLFYHPCVWWISRVVREEREHCCDDVALTTLGDRGQYAQALIRLEELRLSAPSLAMAAANGSLLERIRRIVLPKHSRVIHASTWGVLAASASLSICLAGTLTPKRAPSKPNLPPKTVQASHATASTESIQAVIPGAKSNHTHQKPNEQVKVASFRRAPLKKARLHLRTKATSPGRTNSKLSSTKPTLDSRIVGHWTAQIPNVQVSYPPKDGKPAYHFIYTGIVSLEINNDHTFSRQMDGLGAPHQVGFISKGSWSVSGKFVTLTGEHTAPLICTLSQDGKTLEHIDRQTWSEMQKTRKGLYWIEMRNFSRH